MTSRERILAMLRGQKVDRIPWTPMMVVTSLKLLEGWPDGGDGQPEDLEVSRRQVRFMRQLYEEIGADMLTMNRPRCNRTRLERGVRESTRTEGRTRIETIDTPRGSLVKRLEYRDGFWYTMEPLIKSMQDCEIYEYYLEAQVVEDDFAEAEMFLEEIGDRGIPFPGAPAPAPKEILMRLVMEPGQFLEALMDRQPRLLAMLEAWHRRNLRIYSVLARSPIPVFEDGGSTSNALLSPGLFREFCLPQIREYCGILHAAGKIKVDHATGDPFRGILADIPGSGIDCLMGYREETPGNATLEEIREAWGRRVCLMGGIDTDTLCRWKPDALARKWEYLFSRIRADDRMILATNSAVMPGTSVENLRWVHEVAAGHLWSQAKDKRGKQQST